MARDPRAQRRNAERLGIADAAAIERGLRGRDRASRRRRGRLADLHMDDMPARAFDPAAAAITSITMKGGTSLRAEGVSRRRALSSIIAVPNFSLAGQAVARPRCAVFGGFVGSACAGKRDMRAR